MPRHPPHPLDTRHESKETAMTMSPQTTTHMGTAASIALQPEPPLKGRRRRKTRERISKHLMANRTAYLMIAPMVILLGIFVWWPLMYSFYLSTFEISFYEDPV